MKSDARLLLNKKKWKPGPNNQKTDRMMSRDFKSRGTVDARKILNSKRGQKSKNPVYGSYMKTNNAAAFIASQIRKEIAPNARGQGKQVQLSRDGNLIVTSKSKNSTQMTARRDMLQRMEVDLPVRNRSLQTRMQYEPSTSRLDDLEHTTVGDLIDLNSLPSGYVSTRSLPSANLSRQSVLDQFLGNRNTMIADQIVQPPQTVCAKVYISNLHPSVSQKDVMELFGDVGIIKNAEMLMPGTAIIDFYDANDAQKACDVYHNRLLDGLPMKCYLQTQKSQPQRSSISRRLGERIVAPRVPVTAPSPITTNPRSRINPRNVQFTVKLT